MKRHPSASEKSLPSSSQQSDHTSDLSLSSFSGSPDLSQSTASLPSLMDDTKGYNTTPTRTRSSTRLSSVPTPGGLPRTPASSSSTTIAAVPTPASKRDVSFDSPKKRTASAIDLVPSPTKRSRSGDTSDTFSPSASVLDTPSQRGATGSRSGSGRGLTSSSAESGAVAGELLGWEDINGAELELRRFDLDPKYGPCTGITRKERYVRAVSFGENPGERVWQLIEAAEKAQAEGHPSTGRIEENGKGKEKGKEKENPAAKGKVKQKDNGKTEEKRPEGVGRTESLWEDIVKRIVESGDKALKESGHMSGRRIAEPSSPAKGKSANGRKATAPSSVAGRDDDDDDEENAFDFLDADDEW